MDYDDIMQLDLQGSRDDHFCMPDIAVAFPSFPGFPSVSWTHQAASPLHATSSDLSSSCSSSNNTTTTSSTRSSSSSSACSLLYAPGTAAAMQPRQVESPSLAADDLCMFVNMESIFDLPDIDHWNPSPLLLANEAAAAADGSGGGALQHDAGYAMAAAASPKVQQPAEAGQWPGCGGGVLQEEQGKEAPAKVEEEETRELAQVFLEWMRINKASLSPGDLRSIRLNRDIIEWAGHHVGRSKHGRVHALKLILSWVQHNHLQTRSRLQKSPPNPSHAACLTPPSLPYSSDLTALGNAASGEMAYPGPTPPFSVAMNGHHFPPSPQFASPFSTLSTAGGFRALDEAQCAASRTKEARRRRMEAQRRQNPIHRRSRRYGRQQQTQPAQLPLNLTGGSVNASTHPSTSNWTFWTNTTGSQIAPSMHLMAPLPFAPQTNPQQGGAGSSSVKPQTQIEGWKEEKNLKFLLQKVLKQSDVGSLGRIVLPKKEAEIHLPELDERDGISLPMEDIGSSQVWNMRYRFWPNNKSRMYLLENTGEFVRSNGLQEGDFIVIYLDVKNSTYMIQGVKAKKSATPAIS